MFLAVRVYVYVPFYVAATYAFVRQRSWVQPLCLLYAGAVLGTTLPTFFENFQNARTSEPMLYLAINGLPAAVRYVMWCGVMV